MTSHRKIDQPVNYKIRVKGTFDETWLTYWFDGFVVTQRAAGETTLTGMVADESALHGLLSKIGNLGLELVLLERI
jgi:hypothetical protein